MRAFWHDKKVLVTGGAGFVGANLCRALIDKGASVYGYDLRRGPSWDILGLPKDRLICGSVHDPWDVQTQLSATGAEIVFHLAGRGHISDCQAHPLQAWVDNVKGTWSLLEGCRMMGGQIKAVVMASSNEVYPPLPAGRLGHPWTEADPMAPITAYGVSKACADLLAQSYGRNFGLPVAALRHCNAAGPADPHRSHLVTGTICDLLEGKAPVIRGNGDSVKGYLAVEEVVVAYLLLAEALMTGRIEPGSAWNAAPEAPISVRALVDLVCQVARSDVLPKILHEDLSQAGYVQHLDSSRLRALGWAPGQLGFWLQETYEWYKKHGTGWGDAGNHR